MRPKGVMLSLRLSAQEMSIIARQAEACELSVSAYARQALMRDVTDTNPLVVIDI